VNAKLAKVLSYVGHPGFMPTAYFAVLLFMSKALMPFAVNHKLMILALIANVTLFLPLLIMVLLMQRGYIDSLHVPKKEQRQVPFFMITMAYAVLALIFHQKMSVLPLFAQSMTGMALTQALATLITPYFKISMHGLGLGGLLGGMIALQLGLPEIDLAIPIIGGVFFAGAVLSARLALNAHSVAQVFSGLALGAAVNALSVWAGL
jgi:hypothetical protein